MMVLLAVHLIVFLSLCGWRSAQAQDSQDFEKELQPYGYTKAAGGSEKYSVSGRRKNESVRKRLELGT
jgi:hypothetical protein